jgi:rhodanese-related sulfurtransferase
VREPDELALCHVEGSLQIPMGQIPGRLAELPRDRHILVLCHHGGRSMRVTQFLRANDYPQVSNIAGGIDAWAETVEPGMPRY